MNGWLDETRFPGLPAFSCGEAQETYEGMNDTAVYGFDATTADDAARYRELLLSCGFGKAAETTIGDCTFMTLTKDGVIVRVSHFPAKSLTKIIVTRGEKHPTLEVTGDFVWTPSITQIGRKGVLQFAPGNSYIMRNHDGTYVIIDGGPRDAEDTDHLMTFLKVHQLTADKPVIRLWLFSHPHGDHCNLAMDFWDKYHDEVVLEAVGYNFPNLESAPVKHGKPEDIEFHRTRIRDKAAEYFPEAKIFTPHGGDRYVMPGYVIDTLISYEDYFPGKMNDTNYYSLVWMIRSAHKKVLIPGDCGIPISDMLADVYGSELKCDIMQICHHGNFGATMGLYQNADPDIVLWPEKESLINSWERLQGTEPGYEHNHWIRHSRPRLHLDNSVTTSFMLD
ncbi:MAG: MBL fold metallo-hydrolase [Clostridia bacterium]|nr:MBL fold metallo-hydrolase [Clostridia bacterium]